jgi:uncharacterized protein (TIGR03435 family)
MISKVYVAITLCASMATAQSAAIPHAADPTKSLAFEVVSIRQDVGGGETREFGATPDGFRMVNMPLGRAILEAYVPQAGSAMYWDLAGSPAWLNPNRYDIDARIAEADRVEWQKSGAQTQMLRAMLQTMLAERCKLVVHREMKDASVLYLELGKGGPKFKESKVDEPPRPSRFPGGGATDMEGGSMHFYQAPMTLLASMLTNRNLDGPEIQDRTGLTGRYDFAVEWGAWTGGMAAEEDSSDPGPTLNSAVTALGLKLVPAKGQVETLVIEHIEKPSEN